MTEKEKQDAVAQYIDIINQHGIGSERDREFRSRFSNEELSELFHAADGMVPETPKGIGTSFDSWLDEEGIREEVEEEARRLLARYKHQPWYTKLWRMRCYLAWPFIFIWCFIIDDRTDDCKKNKMISRAMHAKIIAGIHLSDTLNNFITKYELVADLERNHPGFKWPELKSAPLPLDTKPHKQPAKLNIEPPGSDINPDDGPCCGGRNGKFR
jgi:hypothetical protein